MNAGKARLFFDVAVDQKAWFNKLAKSAGLSMIGLLWFLADAYAEQIGFEPRPK